MRHLYRNIAIICIVLFVCAASLWPPEKNLRLGKDLAGGVSFIYAVERAPGDSPDVVDQVIDVLAKRVNPNGLFEISFVKQGRDRIEVSMPLPTERVQTLRSDLEAAINHIDEFHLDDSAVERALRAPESERVAALEALMTSPARRAMLTPVRDAVTAAAEARAAYEAVRAKGDAPQNELDNLVNAAGAAEEQLDQAKRTALTSSVSPDEVRAILRRSKETFTIMDDSVKPSVPVKIESAYQKGIDSLRQRIGSLPDGTASIDAVLAANDAYLAEAKGLDDPQDLERMLQGSGVLEFRIAVRPGERADESQLRDQLHQRGAAGVQAKGVGWFLVNKPEDWFKTKAELDALEANPAGYFLARNFVGDVYAGEYYMLLYDEPGKRLTAAEGNWRLTDAREGQDQFGRPSVNFRLDPAGGAKMGQMSEPNVNKPMAVLLDGRVFTAPNINSRLGRDVMIEGTFTPKEIAYLQQTLKAGSLSARLSEKPLSVTRLAPELGLDNLQKGVRAGIIALCLVSAFMIVYYFTAGFIASIALLANALIILGVMSLNRASFTLPGIAGIILTFGMAVDANVLIYERLREELLAGNDLKSAVRISYQRVLSTIVDSNLTTLIACVVLAYTATQEIKGFAITLGIGVVATMFAALLVTRVIFSILVDKIGIRQMRQLPMVVPAIDRLFTPKIDWISLRPVLWTLSALFVGAGIYFVAVQGSEMLDTEFRGGTAADLQFTQPGSNDHLTFDGKPFTGTLTIEQVRAEIAKIADEADGELAKNPGDKQASELAKFRTASVVAVGDNDGTNSDWYRVKTVITDQDLVLNALMDKFASIVGSQPPLEFVGSESASLTDGAPVHIVEEPVLGDNEWLKRPEVRDDVSPFVGGAAIVLQDITPRVSQAELQQRLDYLRTQGDYVAQTAPRTLHLVVVDGTADAVQNAVILVSDPNVNALFDAAKWRADLAGPEWKIAHDALAQATTHASVQSFSAEVAATFRAKAIVAASISLLLVGIYIWVRFGSARYSLACLLSTMHDVVAVIGMIAMAEVLYNHFPFLGKYGIQPYKIDLGMVAAIMTIIGYSLNDSIIILDRIRENRGKLPFATRKVINNSINQTISRTVITSGTTLMAVLVMLIVGGEGIASFNYTLLCGIIVGTFSSISVAAPCVYTKKVPVAAKPLMEAAEAREAGIVSREREPAPMA